MGFYTEYIKKNMQFEELSAERKKQLKRISEIRGRDILVYASDLAKNAPISIDYSDILPFSDQLANLTGKDIDIILETPGGYAEIVEDLVKLVRDKYDKVGIIIPGMAKSAGTIFAMAGDEILMGRTSSLGPIDAQIGSNGKKYSADAFLQGLEKIKADVERIGRLNPAYIPILQNISPGEIQHCENAQNFSQKLVSEWLTKYKFKYWSKHTSTGKEVTANDKETRAMEIAHKLCDHSCWLTHGRSLKIDDLEEMHLKITNYEETPELNDAIMRYYTLLRMSFDANLYKVFETINTQIYRFLALDQSNQLKISQPEKSIIEFGCPKCMTKHKIQANLKKGVPQDTGTILYPIKDNIFKCPNCGTESNISQIRLQIEAATQKKFVE